MSNDYKKQYDEMRSNLNSQTNPVAEQKETYQQAGNARTLLLVWPCGKSRFLNYSYLVDGDYSPEDNAIILTFTNQRVTIKGQQLYELFIELTSQLPRIITIVEDRYVSLEEKNEIAVTEIIVEHS